MATVVRIGNERQVLTVSSVAVNRSLEQPVSQANVDTREQYRPAIGEPLTIDIDGIRRFTGVVERYPGTPEKGYTVQARGAAVGLMVNDAIGNETFRNRSLNAIAAELGRRSGDVQVRGGDDADVDRFKLRQATSHQRAIQDLADTHGFTLTDAGDGAAVLYQAPAELVPVETWTFGRPPVRDVEVMPAIDDWRDLVVVRGQRSPTAADIADVVTGQIGVDIAAGNTRPSRRVLPNSAANSRARARTLAATELRKMLARSLVVEVDLTETERQVGDIVRVIAREVPAVPLVLSALSWMVTAREKLVTASLRLPAAYGGGDLVDPAEIERVRA